MNMKNCTVHGWSRVMGFSQSPVKRGWWYGYCTLSTVNRDIDTVWREDLPKVYDVDASHMLLKIV